MYDPQAVCDGVVDCHDSTDESIECDVPKCKRDEMACGKPKKCIKTSAWCDGKIDCSGGNDEKHCSKNER